MPDQVPILTTHGYKTPTQDDLDYMDYLDDSAVAGYGLLMFKGDPLAFETGCREWKENAAYDSEQELLTRRQDEKRGLYPDKDDPTN